MSCTHGTHFAAVARCSTSHRDYKLIISDSYTSGQAAWTTLDPVIARYEIQLSDCLTSSYSLDAKLQTSMHLSTSVLPNVFQTLRTPSLVAPKLAQAEFEAAFPRHAADTCSTPEHPGPAAHWLWLCPHSRMPDPAMMRETGICHSFRRPIPMPTVDGTPSENIVSALGRVGASAALSSLVFRRSLG